MLYGVTTSGPATPTIMRGNMVRVRRHYRLTVTARAPFRRHRAWGLRLFQVALTNPTKGKPPLGSLTRDYGSIFSDNGSHTSITPLKCICAVGAFMKGVGRGKFLSLWQTILEDGRNASSFLSVSCARFRANNVRVLRLGAWEYSDDPSLTNSQIGEIQRQSGDAGSVHI